MSTHTRSHTHTHTHTHVSKISHPSTPPTNSPHTSLTVSHSHIFHMHSTQPSHSALTHAHSPHTHAHSPHTHAQPSHSRSQPSLTLTQPSHSHTALSCTSSPFPSSCVVEKRQTVLFSATQTRNVEDLARLSLKRSPLYVGVDDHKDTATVEGLQQVGEGRGRGREGEGGRVNGRGRVGE